MTTLFFASRSVKIQSTLHIRINATISLYKHILIALYYIICIEDFQPAYVSTATTVLSDNQTAAVPVLTINGWILMMRKVISGLVSFNKTWIMYRDGFGPSADNDNYWLGLEKVYRLVQLGNARLRVEVKLQLFGTHRLLTSSHRTLDMLHCCLK